MSEFTPEEVAEYERLGAIYRRATIAAEMYFGQGAMSGEAFQRVMADLTLRVQGVEKPTFDQVKERVRELEVGYSFMSPAPGANIPDN